MDGAEAIVLRIFTKYWNMIELLVRLNLFQKMVTAEELSNHIVEVTLIRLHLNFKNWFASQQDQASTNKCCLKKLKEDLKDANPAKNLCAPHTLRNGGKKWW